MPKKRRPEIKNVEHWISLGHGQGQGNKYRPFLQVRDVPSKGRSHIVPSLKFDRDHHFFSDNEYKAYLLAEYDPSVIEIREQYALLPWDETQEIAEKLGIRYPKFKNTKTPIVLTSDLVLTVNKPKGQQTEVMSIKPSRKIDRNYPKVRRVYEKLALEKMYWQRRGVSFCIITEKDIPNNKFLNLDKLLNHTFVKRLNWLTDYLPLFINLFCALWTPDRSLNQILHKISPKINLEICYCFNLFARAVWLHQLPVDLDSEVIFHNFPVRMIDNCIKDH